MKKLLLALLLIPAHLWIRGVLISNTWAWFVLPITGLRPISIAAGYGLALFFSSLSYTLADLKAGQESHKQDAILEDSFGMLVDEGVILLLAYLVKQFWL